MKKRSIIDNFVFQLIYQLMILLVPLITAPYLARTLGAEGIGIYSYNYAIAYCFVLLTKLGIDNYGAREIAKISITNKNLISAKFWTLFFTKMMMGIISLFLYILYVCLFVKEYKLNSYIFVLYIISAIIDVNWFYIGIENFRFISIRNMIVKVMVMILIFTLVKSKNDLELYTLIVIGGTYFLSQFIGWGVVLKNTIFTIPKYEDMIGCIKPLILLFVPILALNLYRQMDKIMLGSMSNTIQVGLYEYSEKIYMVCISIISVCADVGMPRIVSCLETNQIEKSSKLVDLFTDLGICLSVAMSFGVLAISDKFITLFYGSNFAECSVLLALLSPSIIFLGISIIVRKDFLIPYNGENIFMKASCFGVLINLVINLILIPKFNAQGAVASTVLTECFVLIYQFIKIRHRVTINKYFRHIVWFIISGLVMYSVLKVSMIYLGSSWYSILLYIAIGALIYFPFVLIFIIKNYSKEVRKLLLRFNKQ